MKEKWNKLNKLQKWSLLLFLIALVIMILGLVLIGTVKEGFLTLKWLGVGEVLQLHNKQSFDINLFPNLIQLKIGAVFAAIITPILFGLSILIFGYHVYKIKVKCE